jgi:hypothetical protein
VFQPTRARIKGGHLATRLDKTIKRELELGGQLYMVSMSPEGVRIVPKGKRKGHEISWETLLSGDAELRRDLNMSLDVFDALRETEGDEREHR